MNFDHDHHDYVDDDSHSSIIGEQIGTESGYDRKRANGSLLLKRVEIERIHFLHGLHICGFVVDAPS